MDIDHLFYYGQTEQKTEIQGDIMEYLILAAALLILFVIYLIRCSLEEKKLWRNLKKSLTENYGKPSTKKYQEGRLKTIAGHFQNKKTEDAIDAITWNDLDLDLDSKGRF